MIKITKSELTKNLSTALYYTRWGLDLQQPFVAEKISTTQQQLSAYEQGKTIPSLPTIIALADFYDVSIDYLVGRCLNKHSHKTQKETKFKEDI